MVVGSDPHALVRPVWSISALVRIYSDGSGDEIQLGLNTIEGRCFWLEPTDRRNPNQEMEKSDSALLSPPIIVGVVEVVWVTMCFLATTMGSGPLTNKSGRPSRGN